VIKEDMRAIKNDPYLPKDIQVIGYEYDVFTGKTKEVAVM
jgi:carbonic anhydrase